MQFLKNDALMGEHQAIMRDASNPIHKMKAITDAVNASGAKTVTVTIRKEGSIILFLRMADAPETSL